MLKAAIIYPTGAGGNFLSRLLTLSEKTIPMVRHENSNIDQVTVEMSAQQRFDLYNHFTPQDWRTSEFSIIHQYKWGQNEFYNYEQSPRFLIDTWHPHVFLEEDTKQVLWLENQWEHIIFINCDSADRDFLYVMGEKKDYPPMSQEMYDAQQQLLDKYNVKSITLNFKDLLSWEMFGHWLIQIDRLLELDLDLVLAQQLWTNWLLASQQTWYGTVTFNRQNIYGDIWAPKNSNRK